MGKEAAPPKAKRIVPKAKKKVKIVGGGYSTSTAFGASITIWIVSRMQAVTVVARATTAAGLEKTK